MEIVAQKLNNYLGSIRFVIKRHSVNCGHCTARNTGLKDAQGGRTRIFHMFYLFSLLSCINLFVR